MMSCLRCDSLGATRLFGFGVMINRYFSGSWCGRCAVSMLWVLGLLGPIHAQEVVDETLAAAVEEFWGAESEDRRLDAIDTVVSLDQHFEEVVTALQVQRTYSPTVDTGRQLFSRRNRDGLEHAYVVHVPNNYDATQSHPVRVYLHGGVMRPLRGGGNWWRNQDPFIRQDSLVVFPVSWPESIWWQDSQIENLTGMLNDLRRVYNVDENRVYLLGMSDGATGAFYQAFKATTPWAAFLPFHGHPGVLTNPNSDVDGEMHVANLQNKPFLIVNGGQDRLYPLEAVSPFIQLFEGANVEIDFRGLPQAGHNMDWWPELSASIDSFVSGTSRQPLPDRLTWESEDTEEFNRAHWLIIKELGFVEGESQLELLNTLTRRVPDAQLGISTVGELVDEPGLQLFDVGDDSIISQAGIRPDDIVVEVAGQAISTPDSLRQALVNFAPGDELPISVRRDVELLDLTLRYPMTFVTQTRSAFRHDQSSGRVELRREGNIVIVMTQGVRQFNLLLSPDQFDLSRPIQVVTNGVVSHDALVVPDVGTLLRWASVDQDQSLLFGVELEIRVGSQVGCGR